ncbi:MAG: MBL fold metallo-hydrolase [Candidatus Thermoplasmatota archaeon]|nr:MBL fold metallo-hydrolase [Candidatus Thermoplasmatota archaeon]
MMNLRIVQIPVGPLQMNATLVMDKKTKDTIFFDPGDETERILEIAENEGMNITRLIATHCHFDHVADANKAMEKLGLPLEICPLGEELLGKVGPIAVAFGYAPSKIEAGGFLSEGDIVELGENKFRILHCPGHSPDSLCFYTDGTLIGGDVIFQGAVGRTDLPGGSAEDLMESIRTKILPLPDETIIYPGHGPKTILGEERKHNPYINGTLRLV